jgi:predicted PurR-regulated permease PerM
MSEERQPDAAKSAIRRRQDTLFGTLRRFSRLWGFLAFCILVVILFRGIVLPFIFGLLIAYLLAPIVRWMQPKIGRVLAVIICYLAIIGLLAGFFGLLVPAVAQDVAKLRDTAPVAIEKFNRDLLPRAEQWFYDAFGNFVPAPDEQPVTPGASNDLLLTPLGDGTWRVDLDHVRLSVKEQSDGTWVIAPPGEAEPSSNFRDNVRELLMAQGAELTESIGPLIQAFVAGVADFLTKLVITFMIAAFVLVDLQRVSRFVRSLIPYEYRTDFEELWESMDTGLGGVIRGQLLICLVNGVLTFVGLIIFQIKYSFLLAALAGIFSLIPIFGTIISSIPIVIIAMVSSEHGPAVGPALGILAWIAGIHLLEANVLNPKIIGDSAHIHPVIVIFALLAGEHMFGLVGALLAIPAASLVQTVFLHARKRSDVFARDTGAF